MLADDASRQRLAAQQADLVAALSRRGSVPSGFDVDRVRLAGQTLNAKRRSGIAKSWPALKTSFGEGFDASFAAFAAEVSTSRDGPAADGFAFAMWLDRRGELPAEANREFLAARLWRGPRIALRIRRGIIAIRLPLLGVRLLLLRRFSAGDGRR